MPAPPRYMRFYPAAYAKATIKMSMEEQGTYMRLLCLMWANGGSIENDDSYIAKALPINLNKWLKVKHKILPFLSDGEPGYLTQEKLVEEYQYVSRKNGTSKADEHTPNPGNSFMDASSIGGKPGNSLDESAAHPYAAPRTVHPAASPTAPRAAPPTDYFAGQRAANAKRKEIQRFEEVPEGGVPNALARALDQSRIRSDLNKDYRLLEDGDPPSCGKQTSDAIAIRFMSGVILAFERHGLQPPSDYTVVKSWVTNGCDMLLDILPAVEACLNRISKATDPPQSWKYFAHEVYGRKKINREKNDG